MIGVKHLTHTRTHTIAHTEMVRVDRQHWGIQTMALGLLLQSQEKHFHGLGDASLSLVKKSPNTATTGHLLPPFPGDRRETLYIKKAEGTS